LQIPLDAPENVLDLNVNQEWNMTNSATKQAASSDSTLTTVFGHLDARTLAEVDQVTEQMLMPRSWVVAQIIREWAERRSLEIQELEESWNGSIREQVGQETLDAICDDCRPI
jgi:hypothetical protein